MDLGFGLSIILRSTPISTGTALGARSWLSRGTFLEGGKRYMPNIYSIREKSMSAEILGKPSREVSISAHPGRSWIFM